MVDLLDCPFCGSSDVFVIELEDEDGSFAAAGCCGCGAGSRQHYYCGDDAKEFAADAWNTRPPTPPPVPAITREELVEMLTEAFREGCQAVHDNYQPDPDPDFSEAASDYAASILSRLAAGQPPEHN